jgi:hypothetical protein
MSKQPQQEMEQLSRLILTGFMGAGKSTVGAILARDLGWRFIDLDHVIEANSQRTVAEIFRDYGEAEFRERERQAVRQLSGEEKIVLALGGGTVEDKSNRQEIAWFSCTPNCTNCCPGARWEAKRARCWPSRRPWKPATPNGCRITERHTSP